MEFKYFSVFWMSPKIFSKAGIYIRIGKGNKYILGLFLYEKEKFRSFEKRVEILS